MPACREGPARMPGRPNRGESITPSTANSAAFPRCPRVAPAGRGAAESRDQDWAARRSLRLITVMLLSRLGKPIDEQRRNDATGTVCNWATPHLRCSPITMYRMLMIVLAATVLFAPGVVGAEATTATNLPVAATPSTTVTDTVTHAIASEDLERATLARLEQEGQWQELGKRATALEAEFESLAANPAANAELIDVITLGRRLRVLRGDVSTIVDELGSITAQLEHDRVALDSDARKWRERLPLLEGERAPSQIVERARSAEAKLQDTR